MLPKKAIQEYKRLYKKRFNKELNDTEAIRRANNLVDLYKIVYGSASFYQIKNHIEKRLRV